MPAHATNNTATRPIAAAFLSTFLASFSSSFSSSSSSSGTSAGEFGFARTPTPSRNNTFASSSSTAPSTNGGGNPSAITRPSCPSRFIPRPAATMAYTFMLSIPSVRASHRAASSSVPPCTPPVTASAPSNASAMDDSYPSSPTSLAPSFRNRGPDARNAVNKT